MRTICTATENKYSIEYFYGFVRYFVFALLYVFAGKSTVRNNADNYADLSNGTGSPGISAAFLWFYDRDSCFGWLYCNDWSFQYKFRCSQIPGEIRRRKRSRYIH